MSERYDFSYWPPRPLPRPEITPAEDSFSDELCRHVLYIPNDNRRQAVYANGEWVDIQDFWLNAKDPRPEDINSSFNNIIETNPITGVINEYKKVRSRTHLSGASYAFHNLGYELARLDADNNAEPGDDHHLFEHTTRAQKFLFHKAFNGYEKSVNRLHILIAREAVEDIYERRAYLPMGSAAESELIYAKVALKWRDEIENLGARDWT